MSEAKGVGIAVLSCCFGAGAAVATRHLIGAPDPPTLAAVRGLLAVFAGIWTATTDPPARARAG